MNDFKSNYEDDEMVINLKDLLAYIIRCWRLLAGAAVLLAIVVCTVLSYKDYAATKDLYSDEQLTALQDELSDSEVESINQLYSRYLAYKDQIRYNQLYLDRSVYMRLDPNFVSVYTAEYQVDSAQKGIIDSFSRLVLGLDEYQRIAKICGDAVDERFVYEIVSISGSDDEDSLSVDVDHKDEIYSGNISSRYKGVMVVTINALNREQCERIASVVEEAIGKHLTRLTNAGVDVKLERIGDTYTETLSTALADQQKKKIAEGTNLIAEFTKFEKDYVESLSGEEKDLYDFYVRRGDNVEADNIHWKKYAVIGFGAGFILAFLYVVLKYLFSDSLLDAGIFEQQYGIGILGMLYADKKNKGLGTYFSRLADKIAYNRDVKAEEESLQVIEQRVLNLCQREGCNSLHLVTGGKDSHDNMIVEKICAALTNAGVKVSEGNPVLSVSALQDLNQANAAIIMAVLGRSGKDNLNKCLQLCSESGAKVLGAVVYSEL